MIVVPAPARDFRRLVLGDDKINISVAIAEVQRDPRTYAEKVFFRMP